MKPVCTLGQIYSLQVNDAQNNLRYGRHHLNAIEICCIIGNLYSCSIIKYHAFLDHLQKGIARCS